MPKIKYTVLALLIVSLGVSFCIPYFLKRHRLENPKQEEYYLYASCYPVYAAGTMIMKNVPGMHWNLLTQPQENAYKQYTISDWEQSILSKADGIVMFGDGFESFAAMYSASDIAAVNLYGGIKLKSLNDYIILDLTEDSDTVIPWSYLSLEGFREVCSAFCANMLALDEMYTDLYYKNLDEAYQRIDDEQSKDAELLLANIKVAVLHEALVYPAEELGAGDVIIVRRDVLQELSRDEINECTQFLMDNGAELVLVEKHAPVDLIHSLIGNGFKIAVLDLMLDRNAMDGTEGYFQTIIDNREAIKSAL